MYRNKEIKIRLTEKELERLNRNAGKTTFSREGYIRTILNGYDPQASPPEEYWSYIRELWHIGDEINNIADEIGSYDLDIKKRISELRHRLGKITGKLQSIYVPQKSTERKRVI